MSKISTYEVAPVPKLADKLIGTSVGGEIEDITYNFTLSELLNLFIPNIPANTLQGVLDYGNTATQDIILNGTIFTTYLEVTDTATILDSFLTGETHITGGLYDRLNSIGTAGQVLTSTGTQVEWYTIPTVIPDLQQVLAAGNTAVNNIILTGNLSANNAALLTSTISTSLTLLGTLRDGLSSVGANNQVLSSNVSGVRWVNLPVYSATSPLLYNSGTGVFSIQQANASQDGYLSSADWITFDGKQTAISLTTTGNSGPSTLIGATINVPNYTLAGLGGVPLTRTLTINGITYNLAADRSWTIAAGVSSVTATSPLFSTGGVNPDISIQQSSSSLDGYLSSTDWLTFNSKQPAGNYITSLTGEATGTGPGAASVTLSNAAVIGKLLTGLNITGSTISSSDSILTAFGKVQNQINGLIGGVQYQGVWNANTNTPALVSSVGTQGYYYIVSVAGNTNLNGITDWQVGDWAIFNGSTWNKVDNTDLVTSVNGQVGAVSLTTDNIPEGATNLYYLDSRARAALSFAAGSGAYNSTTGVITIPTDNSQILNGAGYITLVSLSATSPLSYNNLTGAFSIQVANTTQNGYLSSTDWNTFNGKQDYLNGTGLVKSVAGVISYITDNSANWNTAYNDSIVSAAVTGTATKTLTLNQQDGGTITASWSDIDTGLTSVGVSMPTAFTVTNSPLTSNGTIAITGSGSTLQYIDGTGALQTFPGLTGYIPYTGATQNVDLGEFGISAGYFQADLTPTGALQVGRMQWNSTDGTMDLRLLGNNVTLQIGQENVTRVVNKSGVNLLEANYQVVRIRKVAEGGTQGQRLAVVLAQGNNENNSTEVIGLVTETINNNQEGFVTSFGEVKSINTTGSLQGETWVDGDILYLSSTIAGQLTNIRPVAPNHSVIVGYVVYAHANNGKIYMAIDTGYELGELHNVYAPTPAANQSIYWNTTNSRYELNTIGGILGYTPANDTLVVHLAGNETITGLKTFNTPVILNNALNLTFDASVTAIANNFAIYANKISNYSILSLYDTDTAKYSKLYFDNTTNRTYTFPNASGTIALTSDLTGYVPTSRTLTINGTTYDLSADRSWSITAGVSSVTASSPLASSGGSTPNITIQQSSASQDGYLSSTDWTTFNSKQASGNYITSLTGEATATGPGAAAVTLNNASVTAKILTGVNITGGTVQATDTMLTAFGKLQNQINGLIGSTIYQGTWNALTNTPALVSSVGTQGYYYIVSVAGTTNLDGITDWNIGDWAIFNGGVWQQVDNTDSVSSVNGFTGAVSLTTDNIPEGATNLYFTNTRARNAISLTTTGTSGAATYNNTTGAFNIPNYTTDLTGYVPYTGATTNVTLGAFDLTADNILLNSGLAFLSRNLATNYGVLGLVNGAIGRIQPAALFVDRYYTLPDATGTIALTSDLSAYVPTSRTLTINGTGYDLSANRSWTIPTSVNATFTQDYTATASQTTFTVTGGYTVGQLAVYYNGSKLAAAEFTATNGTTFVLATACQVNDIVQAVVSITGGGIGGSGTTNYHPKFSSSSAITTSGIYEGTAGFISIGNTNTTYNLDVTGTGRFTGAVRLGTDFAQLLPITASNYQLLIGNYYDGTNIIATATAGSRTVYNVGGMDFRTFTGATVGNTVADTSRMIITNGGVGSFYNSLFAGNADTNAFASANRGVIVVNGISNSLFGLTVNSVNKAYLYQDGTNLTLQNIVNGAMAFGTNDTERMRITSAGKLLVGKTTGSGNLGGSANVEAVGTFYSSGSQGGYFWEDRTNGAYWYGWYATGASTVYFYNGNSGTNIASINPTTGVYTPLSDINKKKDFEVSTIGLNEVLQLKPTLYRMKADDESEPKQLGFLAQEVQPFIPQAYIESKGEGEDKFIGLNYNAIVVALVKGMQEQQAQIQNLQEQINILAK